MSRISAASAALAFLMSPAFADEPPKPVAPEFPKPVLSAEEGMKLYRAGVHDGLAQAAVQNDAMQRDMKPILDKMAPPKP